MNWIPLETDQQLHEIIASDKSCLLFKHSTRCPVSSMAKRNITMDAGVIPPDIPIYYLDLIEYRNLSDAIARIWGVRHESPQLLLVKAEVCLYHTSHEDINLPEAIGLLGNN